MKRKLLLAAMTVIMVVACAVGFTACGDNGGMSVDGTYYLYVNDTLDKTQFITLNDKTWTDDEGETGEYSLSGSSITLYAELLGEQEEFASGTVKDGVLTLDIMGVHIVYCKEGVTPPSDSGETPQEKYTVTYDANGGVFGNDETTFAQNDIPADSLLTAPTSPTRDGYSFAGWAKKKNGSELWMFDTDKVSGNTTLYAVWTQKSGIIVSVDGASIDGTNIFMLVEPSADSVSLSSKVICSEDSTWKLYYDKLGQVEIPTKIAAGQSGVLENGNNIFYIVVTSGDGTQVNTYQLTIHRSYEVDVRYYNDEEILKTESVYTGNKFTADYVPQIKGYMFNGWKTSDGEAFTEATVMGAFSLYADKTALSYEVTLDVNGGDELSKDTVTVTFDSSYSFPVPTREGYTFLGWYDEGTRLTDEDGESVYAWSYDLDMTVTAKWEANEYTVTLNRNDIEAGTVSGGGEHAYDSEVTITAQTNDGYTWLGWYDGNDELVTEDTSYTFITKQKVSYTAKWTYYTLSSNATGKGTASNYKDKKITAGEEVTLKAENKEGGTFVGWFKGETLLTKEFIYVFNMPEENISCTAKFIECPITVKVSGYYQNGYVGKAILPSDTVLGKEVTLSTELLKLGYVFEGWYKNDELVSNESNYTFTLTEEEAEYVARFGLADGMEYFEFTSTSSTCTITDVKEDAVDVAEITIPDCVTNIKDFGNDIPFIAITIPESVTSIEYGAFYDNTDSIVIYCEAAKKPAGWQTSWETGANVVWNCKNNRVADDGNMYEYVDGIRYRLDKQEQTAVVYIQPFTISGDIVIPASVTFDGTNYSVSGLYNYGNYSNTAFGGCNKLTSIALPEGIEEIGNWMFNNCSSLESVTIPKSIKEMNSYAFASCDALKSVYISDLEAWLKIVFQDNGNPLSNGADLYLNGEKVTELIIPAGVTSIGEYAFDGCKSLTCITIPEGVTSIGGYAFYNCTSLTIYCELTEKASGWSSDWNVSNCPVVWNCNSNETADDGYIYTVIDGIRYALKDANAMVVRQSSVGGAIVIPKSVNYNSTTYSVTSIDSSAFYGCISLTSITIPDSVTSIGEYTFYKCTSLTSIMIPDSVTSIGKYAFYNCTSLTSVTIPDGVTSIGEYAFYNCTSLTSVTIPDGVTSIGEYAFYNCTSLTSITIPDSVTSIEMAVFYNCSSLTSLTIGNGVTSIGHSAFYGCSSLTDVTMLDVKRIDNMAFYGCSSLTSITITSNISSIEENSFNGCRIREITFIGTKAQWNSFWNSSYSDLDEVFLYIDVIHCTDGDISKS